jgi:hypothetical protein
MKGGMTVKRDSQARQNKYLQMTQKSGCISTDYSAMKVQEDTMVVLSDDTKKSGYFRGNNHTY